MCGGLFVDLNLPSLCTSQAELDGLSELQGDKDLVQEVQRLRRSLEDAECLSRDTKKEWAFLRSENLSLKERDVSVWIPLHVTTVLSIKKKKRT